MNLFKIIIFIFKLGPEEVLRRIEYFSVDHLTGLHNRRAIKTICEGFSVVFIDLDDFKKVNDEFGYCAGDELLRKFSDILKGLSRSDDIFIRWGGDEFVLLLPKTTKEQANKLVLRIKRELRKKEILIKFSHGIVEKQESGEKDLFLLIEKVSKKMQQNKNQKKSKK